MVVHVQYKSKGRNVLKDSQSACTMQPDPIFKIIKIFRNPICKARGMAQQLEAHTALAKDRSLIPRNHKKQHTTTYNSSLAELDTLLWLLVEMVVEESGGQSQPQIQSGVEASLRYINLCQKKISGWRGSSKYLSIYTVLEGYKQRKTIWLDICNSQLSLNSSLASSPGDTTVIMFTISTTQ